MNRRPVKIGVCLLVGAAVNVLCAWAIVASSQSGIAVTLRGTDRFFASGTWPAGTPASWPEPESWGTAREMGLSLLVQSTNVLQLASGEWVSIQSQLPVWTSGNDPLANQSRRALASQLLSTPSASTVQATTVSCGWPFFALGAVRWEVSGIVGTAPPGAAALLPPPRWWVSGIPISGPSATRPARRLPVQPLVRGFIGNTFVFGGVAAVLGMIPGVVLRRFRKRCGLCLACGYPIGAVPVCAECGGKVTVGPEPRLPRPVRRPLVAWVMLAAIVAVLYVTTARWGACLKTESGWYGGLWAGRLAIGYSRTPFMSPGLETGKFAIPFSLGFHQDADHSRWIVGLPLWSVLLVIVPGIARRWWRYAIFRTISGRHPPPAEITPHPADSPGAASPSPSGP